MKLSDLFEAPVSPESDLKIQNLDHGNIKAIQNIVESQCSDSIWMFEKNTPIYRGFRRDLGDAAIINTLESERKSENTQNFYTILIDNLKVYNGWPKRSKSLICSSNYHTASGYDEYESAKIIIPFNGSKIGFVNEEDMWDTMVPIRFENGELIESLNIRKAAIRISLLFDDDDYHHPNYQSFLTLAERLKDRDLKSVASVQKTFSEDNSVPERVFDDFIGFLNEIFDPKTLGFTMATTSTLTALPRNSELWVQGKCLVMSVEVFNRLCESIGE